MDCRKVLRSLLHVPKTLQKTVYETVNSSWRPSCFSISFNVDSFGYYLTSRKRSDKPFTNPSTLRGGPSCGSIPFSVDSFRYYYTSQKCSNKPSMNPSSLCGDLPVAQFPST
ncbi:uncharacterized protein LACBIDRAFT_335596 [Laccaria bicolor S238N-H82]|uniref:Predicted protein n=1 Tax=Laccaria bicolor (strain S238N-H82 / ATCC MYA-4686) TaxID=486041 RepID=B0E2T1_LACBS|nr:uncharacterized protein LACBIDRAFT_335596 [Laccaria bicolor S238N-H82]EDQ98850.1 predicted protein [Laccaria bicolor S238N-H82]|eukprot:XP_001890503.1 predicted protein [Laccaria bicolor S238N-H82]